MKTKLTILLISINCLLLGQSNIVKEVNNLIKKETIDQADKKVDEYLAKEPNNVDVLMLKGNVVYYKYKFSQPQVSINVNDNESIFDRTVGFIKPYEPIVPEDVAIQVTSYFLKAVSIDNSRTDIHLGICYTYSISGMTDKLIEYLPLLKKVMNEPNFEYSMGDYARNLIVRDMFDSGMKVYQRISELYPESGGILSDIAAEYLFHGDFDAAKKYMDFAVQKKDIDTMTLGNAFFINSILGNYSTAFDLLKKQSLGTNNKDYLLYQALLDFKDEKNYKSTINDFLNSNPKNSEEKKLAELVSSNKFSGSLTDYDSLLTVKLNDAFKIVIHESFVKKYPKAFEPQFNLAETYTYNNLFKKAIETFNFIDTTVLNKIDKERYLFYSAYANYKIGNLKISVTLWMPLLRSDDFYYKSAAAYFIGRYYEKQNELNKANEYYNIVANRSNESKYATYSWNRVNYFKKMAK